MTTRLLVLVRHAKTESGSPDIARALTEQGRRDAAEIGRWLQLHDFVPDLAAVSPALRARQTWQLAADRLPRPVRAEEDGRIFDNTVDDLLDVVTATEAQVARLAVVGHNPSMHALAVGLAGGDGEAVGSLADFPTATVAVFTVESEWADVGGSACPLAAVATCRG